MKVDIKNMPDEKRKSKFGKKPEKVPAKKMPQEETHVQGTVPENSTEEEDTNIPSTGNVYLDSINRYKEEYAKKLNMASLLRSNKFWIAVLVVLFFVFLSVNSNSTKARNQLTVQYNRTSNEVDKLTTAVTELKMELDEQARIDSVVMSNEEEELARNDAKVQGAQVAYLQNKFGEVKVTDPELVKKKDEIKKELDPYFSEDAKRLGKGAWYPFLEGGIPGKWEFASNASFKGNTMKVLWFFYANDPENPDDHSMLAYCTAVYHADDGLFYDVEIKTTSYAEANASRDEEEYVPNNDEESIMEQLQSLAGEGSTPPADEDYVDEATEGRDEYKDKAAHGEIEGEEYDNRYNPGLGGSLEDESGSERSE